MTVMEAIGYVDNVKPNRYSQTEKIGWLSTLDGRIKEEIIDTHEGGENVIFHGYSEADASVELLVPAPRDSIYVRWLESMIDYANGEIVKYNNTSAAFNVEYAEFARHYNRTHMPKGKKLKFD